MCREAGWTTTHFPALGHDTTYCIVIGKGTGTQGLVVGGHDMANSPTTRPQDMTGQCAGQAAACAPTSWPLGCVTIQFLYRKGEGGLVSRHSVRHDCDTTPRALRYCTAVRHDARHSDDTALRHGPVRHDTAQCATTRPSAPCHDIMRATLAQCAPSVLVAWVP